MVKATERLVDFFNGLRLEERQELGVLLQQVMLEVSPQEDNIILLHLGRMLQAYLYCNVSLWMQQY